MSGNDIDPRQLELAYRLLNGVRFKKTNKGPILHRYLDGEEEREGRIALARLLHAEGHRRMDRLSDILWALAMLFDPTPHGKEPREIVIQPRKRGRATSYVLEADIAGAIAVRLADGRRGRAVRDPVDGAEKVYHKVNDAIADVARAYGKSISTVKEIWSEHKRGFDLTPRGPTANQSRPSKRKHRPELTR